MNLSTLMFVVIESCWYLILRAISFLLHLTLINDYNSYAIMNYLIALTSCLILLCFHCHCELFYWHSWCQGLYIYIYGYLDLYKCARLTYEYFMDIIFDFSIHIYTLVIWVEKLVIGWLIKCLSWWIIDSLPICNECW